MNNKDLILQLKEEHNLPLHAWQTLISTHTAEDAQFAAFAEGKVGTRPLREIYADYRALERTYEDRARRMAAEMLAAARATPGALGHAAPGTGYYTREQVHAMSQAEVAAHYEEIRRSMAAWQ